MPDTNRERIEFVARKLGALLDQVVFVGGATTEFLITEAHVQDIRPTLDVDLIVDVLTRTDYYILSDQLRELGFMEKAGEGHPICRWTIDNLLVDIMPTNSDILGFSNRWYADAINNTVAVSLSNTINIQVVSPPYFLATKLEAYHGRGEDDIYTSHDLEDILTLIDGRPELLEEIEQVPESLRKYLSEEFSSLIGNRDFNEAIYGFFPGDATSQARIPQVLDKCRKISEV